MAKIHPIAEGPGLPAMVIISNLGVRVIGVRDESRGTHQIFKIQHTDLA